MSSSGNVKEAICSIVLVLVGYVSDISLIFHSIKCRDVRHTSLIPGQRDPLEKGMATHSSILVWRIPWTEEPGRLQSMGWQTAGHD